jgi:hypothetical protein
LSVGVDEGGWDELGWAVGGDDVPGGQQGVAEAAAQGLQADGDDHGGGLAAGVGEGAAELDRARIDA